MPLSAAKTVPERRGGSIYDMPAWMTGCRQCATPSAYGRVPGCPSLAAHHDARASGGGLLNPGLDPVRLPRVDQRADLGLGRERIANAQRPDPRGKTVHELGLDVGVYENPLGRDAHLTSMAISVAERSLPLLNLVEMLYQPSP
jgi:hypothetical protein